MKLTFALLGLAAALTAACSGPDGAHDAGCGPCGCAPVNCGPCQPVLRIHAFETDGGRIYAEGMKLTTDSGAHDCYPNAVVSCELAVNGPGTYAYELSAPGYVTQSRADTLPPEPPAAGSCGCARCPEGSVDVVLTRATPEAGMPDAGP